MIIFLLAVIALGCAWHFYTTYRLWKVIQETLDLHESVIHDWGKTCSICGSGYPCFTVLTLLDSGMHEQATI